MSRTAAVSVELEARARQSLGSSHDAIYAMVARALAAREISHAHLVDVGCGTGALLRAVADRLASYVGVDAVRYDGFPDGARFVQADLDADHWPLPAEVADVVTAVETIEHLENPWAFMRQLASLVKPGGWVIVTTPNQRSLLSLATLFAKGRFSAFQDSHYPAHRTALLESDLERAAAAARLKPMAIAYSLHGRLPLTGSHYPLAVVRAFPRALSDNLLLMARKSHG